jgi:LmbE family N-acetylglucosaminyl deacetylase
MWDDVNSILFVLAHFDDLEFGAGGSVHRWTREGKHVRSLVLSCPSYTRRDGTTRWKKDVFKAAHLSEGILWHSNHLEDVTVGGEDPKRTWPLDPPPADNRIVSLIDQILFDQTPDVVITTAPYCTQPGHRNVGEAVMAATRRHSRVLLMDPFPPDQAMRPFSADLYVPFDLVDHEARASALECWKDAGGVTPEQIRGAAARALFRGYQAGVEFAECFEAVRWVG